jgi:hypothetical protein
MPSTLLKMLKQQLKPVLISAQISTTNQAAAQALSSQLPRMQLKKAQKN